MSGSSPAVSATASDGGPAPAGTPALHLRRGRRRHRRRRAGRRIACEPLVASTAAARRCSAASAASAGCSPLDPGRVPPAGAGGRRPTGSAPRLAGRPGHRPATTPSASTWWPCASTTWCASGAEPLFFLDYIAAGSGRPGPDGRAGGRGRRGLPPGRLRPHRRRDGRAPRRAWRRTSSTWPASPSAWSSGTDVLGPARVRRRRRADRPALAGPALQRLHPGPPRAARAGRAVPATTRPGRGRRTSLADELLRPSVHLHAGGPGGPRGALDVHAVAHITGGGIVGNLPRALPPEGFRRRARPVQPGTCRAIFAEIQRLGRVADDEMARVFNLGLGMVLVVDADGAADASTRCAVRERGPRWSAGWTRPPRGGVRRAGVLDRGGRPLTCRSRRHERAAPGHRVRRPARPPAGRTRSSRGDFTLKSGRKSSWFIDSKQTVCRPEAMVLVADAVLSVVPPDADRHRRADHGGRPRGLRDRRGGGHPGPPAQGLQRAQGGQGPRRRAAASPAPSTRATRW